MAVQLGVGTLPRRRVTPAGANGWRWRVQAGRRRLRSRRSCLGMPVAPGGGRLAAGEGGFQLRPRPVGVVETHVSRYRTYVPQDASSGAGVRSRGGAVRQGPRRRACGSGVRRAAGRRLRAGRGAQPTVAAAFRERAAGGGPGSTGARSATGDAALVSRVRPRRRGGARGTGHGASTCRRSGPSRPPSSGSTSTAWCELDLKATASWAEVVAAAVDGFELVVAHVPGDGDGRHVAARADPGRVPWAARRSSPSWRTRSPGRRPSSARSPRCGSRPPATATTSTPPGVRGEADGRRCHVPGEAELWLRPQPRWSRRRSPPASVPIGSAATFAPSGSRRTDRLRDETNRARGRMGADERPTGPPTHRAAPIDPAQPADGHGRGARTGRSSPAGVDSDEPGDRASAPTGWSPASHGRRPPGGPGSAQRRREAQHLAPERPGCWTHDPDRDATPSNRSCRAHRRVHPAGRGGGAGLAVPSTPGGPSPSSVATAAWPSNSSPHSPPHPSAASSPRWGAVQVGVADGRSSRRRSPPAGRPQAPGRRRARQIARSSSPSCRCRGCGSSTAVDRRPGRAVRPPRPPPPRRRQPALPRRRRPRPVPAPASAHARRLAAGTRPAPGQRAPSRLPQRIAERRFEDSVDRLDALVFTAKRLADELAPRLALEGHTCTRLLVTAETEHQERSERVVVPGRRAGRPAMVDRARVAARLVARHRRPHRRRRGAAAPGPTRCGADDGEQVRAVGWRAPPPTSGRCGRSTAWPGWSATTPCSCRPGAAVTCRTTATSLGAGHHLRSHQRRRHRRAPPPQPARHRFAHRPVARAIPPPSPIVLHPDRARPSSGGRRRPPGAGRWPWRAGGRAGRTRRRRRPPAMRSSGGPARGRSTSSGGRRGSDVAPPGSRC